MRSPLIDDTAPSLIISSRQTKYATRNSSGAPTWPFDDESRSVDRLDSTVDSSRSVSDHRCPHTITDDSAASMFDERTKYGSDKFDQTETGPISFKDNPQNNSPQKCDLENERAIRSNHVTVVIIAPVRRHNRQSTSSKTSAMHRRRKEGRSVAKEERSKRQSSKQAAARDNTGDLSADAEYTVGRTRHTGRLADA